MGWGALCSLGEGGLLEALKCLDNFIYELWIDKNFIKWNKRKDKHIVYEESIDINSIITITTFNNDAIGTRQVSFIELYLELNNDLEIEIPSDFKLEYNAKKIIDAILSVSPNIKVKSEKKYIFSKPRCINFMYNSFKFN